MTILSKCHLPSSYGLGVMMFLRFGGKESLTDSVMSEEDVCTTALATPGLLKISNHYRVGNGSVPY